MDNTDAGRFVAQSDRSRGVGRRIVLAATFSIQAAEIPFGFWIETLALPLGIELAPYGQVIQQLLDPGSAFSLNADGFNVLLLRPEDSVRHLPAELGRLLQLDSIDNTVTEWIAAIRAFAARSLAPLLVFGAPPSTCVSCFESQRLFRIDQRIADELTGLAGVHYIRHSEVVSLYPVERFEDLEADRLAHIPYTTEYLTAVATVVMRRIVRVLSPPHKVYVLDCDNTLWGGICGEQSPAELNLTEEFMEFQRLLVRQEGMGVLLCLCSKNNPADVELVFEQRRDMPLRVGNFVSVRINWEPKALNIESIAEELKLGLDSFVFIDDNPAECAEVRARHPEILTLQIPQDSMRFRDFIRHTWAFDLLSTTSDASRRTALYKEDRQRKMALAEAGDFREFLAGLDLQVRVRSMEPAHLDRVAELLVRTNQFNLTTVRRSHGQIAAFLREEGTHAKIVDVSDRFGDYGLTGVIFLRISGKVATVDTFLLSCRVLGRGVEAAILSQLGRWGQSLGLEYLRLKYTKTARNAPARRFLQQTVRQFEVSTSEGSLYDVPVDCAVAVTVDQYELQAEPEEVGSSAAVRIQSGQEAPRWYQTTQLLGRASDIVREIDRCYLPIYRARKVQSQLDAVPATETAPESPRGEVEESLAEIWRDLLGREPVSRNDNFFRLGGDSVLVVKLISRIAKRFAVELSMAAVFRCRSFAELARLIAALDSSVMMADSVELDQGTV